MLHSFEGEVFEGRKVGGVGVGCCEDLGFDGGREGGEEGLDFSAETTCCSGAKFGGVGWLTAAVAVVTTCGG